LGKWKPEKKNGWSLGGGDDDEDAIALILLLTCRCPRLAQKKGSKLDRTGKFEYPNLATGLGAVNLNVNLNFPVR
jgi:hypothetical protein